MIHFKKEIQKIIAFLAVISMSVNTAPSIYAETEEPQPEETMESTDAMEESNQEIEEEQSEYVVEIQEIEDAVESNEEGTIELPETEKEIQTQAEENEEGFVPEEDSSIEEINEQVDESLEIEEDQIQEIQETIEVSEEIIQEENSVEEIQQEEIFNTDEVYEYEFNVFGESLERYENGEYDLSSDTFDDAAVVQTDSLIRKVMRFARRQSTGIATVSDFKYLGAYTGTAPFDDNDEAGNDSSQTNAIVRSYDKIVYRTSYAIESSDGSAITNGTLHFKATLPVSSDIATWDLVSMGWLQNAVVNEENGSQILSGDVTFSGGQIAPRIGVINWVISVNSAANGLVINTPSFAFWINDDAENTYNENTNPVTISAKTNVDAGIEYIGKDDDGNPQWLVTTSLMSLPLEKGIKGQQLPDTTKSVKIDLELDNGMQIISALNNDDDHRGGIVNVTGSSSYSLMISDVDYSPFSDAIVNNESTYTIGTYIITTTPPSASTTLRPVSNRITHFEVIDQGQNIMTDVNPYNNIAQYEDGGTAQSTAGGAEYGPVNSIYTYRYSPTLLPIGVNTEGMTPNAIDHHPTNTASNFKDDGALKVNVGDFVNFNIVEYSEQKMWKDTEHAGVKSTATFIKLDGSIYDFASTNDLGLGDAAGFRVGYSIDEVGDAHAEAVWSSAKNSDYAFYDANTKLYFVAKTDGKGWSSDHELLDARFSSNRFELFETTADLKASGKQLVGFYVVVKDITTKMDQTILAMSQPVVRLRISTPYLVVNKNALVNESGDIYAKNDPSRVHIVAVDSEYTMNDGEIAAHYSSSSYSRTWNQEGNGRFNVHQTGGFQKATYDINGNMITPSKSDVNYNSSDYGEGWQNTNDVNFVSALGGTAIYPNEYSFAVTTRIVQQTNGTMKNVFNLDLGQREVDFEIEAETLPVPMNVRNEPIYVVLTIPEDINPVNPNASTVEEKWNISYGGNALQDASTNGGAGITWQNTVTKMNQASSFDTNATYSVYEENNTIVWALSNYPIGYKIPKINVKGIIGNEDAGEKDVASNVQIELQTKVVNSMTSPTLTAQSTVGLTTIRMGGGILNKEASPSIRTNDNNRIAFDVSYTDQGVLRQQGKGKVGVIDILPFDDGDKNADLDLGDYLLTNVSFEYSLKHIEGSVALPSITFYYTDADPKTIANAEENFLTSEGKLYDFAGWKSIEVHSNDQVVSALLNKHITAIGWVMHNAGDGSYANVHYEYRWEDEYADQMHRYIDDLYNTAVVAGEDGVLQRTEAKASSISNCHILLIDYLEKDTEAIMWKRYEDITKDKDDYYSVESPLIAGYHLVDPSKDTNVSGYMPSKFHHIKVYYERNIITGSLVTVYKTADPTSGTKVNVGDTITYTLKAINTGAFTSKKITITDPIPVGTTYVSNTGNGQFNKEKNTVTWVLNPLESGKSQSVTLKVKVNADMEDKVVYNVATYRTEDDVLERETVVTQHPLGKAQGGTVLEAVKGASASTVSSGSGTIAQTWTYTGSDQTYTVTQDGKAVFDLYGAQSGTATRNLNNGTGGWRYEAPINERGAYGGRTQGTFDVKKGDIITIQVGGQGNSLTYAYGERIGNNNNGYPLTGNNGWQGTNDNATYQAEWSTTGWWHGYSGNGGYSQITITRNGNVVGTARANGGGNTGGTTFVRNEASNGYVTGGTATLLQNGTQAARTGHGYVSMSLTYQYNVVKSDVGALMDADITDGRIHYTLSITNVNPLTNYDVVIVDNIPSGTTYVSGSASGNGKYNQDKNRVEWYVGELKSGETKQYTFDVKLDFTQSIIQNQAEYANNVSVDNLSKTDPKNKTNIVQHVIQGGMSIVKRWENDDTNLEQRPNAIDVVIKNTVTSQERAIALKASEGWQTKVSDIDTNANYLYYEKTVPDGYETACNINTPCQAMKVGQTFLIDFTNVFVYSIDGAKKVVKNAKGEDINQQVVKEKGNLYYEITVDTTSSQTKDSILTITDTLPFGTEFISADHDGKYDKGTGVISWNIPVRGKTSTTVRFTVKTNGQANTIVNKATARFHHNELETNEVINYLAYLNITKKLPINKYEIWGNPSFLFRVTDTSGNTIYQSISMDESNEGSIKVNLPHEGIWTIEEVEDVRYKLTNVDGIVGDIRVKDKMAVADVKVNTMIPNVQFTNEPIWDRETHESLVINQIK